MSKHISFVVIAVFFAAIAGLVYGQQDMNDPAMKAMMAYATPGPVQKTMHNMVGTWDAVVKSYMDPAKPTESKATATYVSLLDGRYVQETVIGDFMGMPFHGIGTHGYDNVLKKYVSAWVDNFSTGIMMSCGTSSDDGKTINYVGKGTDPVTGKEQTYRSTQHLISPDQTHMEMYGPGPDGKEMKLMEIIATRKK